MCSYNRFIPNFPAITKPLIRLTKKFTKFEWSKVCQVAFDLLIEILTAVQVLAYPDTNKPYILYTGASNDCIGACLCQKRCNQGKWSQRSQMKNLFTICHINLQLHRQTGLQLKDLFAIFYALQKLDQYLHSLDFVIRTDYKPLKYIMYSPVQNKKIQHWTTNIHGYNCKIEYIKGKKNDLC